MGSIAMPNEEDIRALEKYGVSIDGFVEDVAWVVSNTCAYVADRSYAGPTQHRNNAASSSHGTDFIDIGR